LKRLFSLFTYSNARVAPENAKWCMHFKRRVRQVSEFPFWFVILAGVCSTLVLSRYRGAGAPSSSQLGAWQQFNSVHKLKYAHSDSQCKVARGQPTPASVAAAGRIGIRADSIASRIHTLPFVHSSKVDIVPNGNYRGCLKKKLGASGIRSKM
jgi:hypothetical protein